MISKIDQYLMDKMDQLLAWAQKRHAVNLAHVRFLPWVFVWFVQVLAEIIRFNFIVASAWFLLWGTYTLISYAAWKDEKDYVDNYRKTLSLNANVLSFREFTFGLRYFSLIFSSFVVGTDIGIILIHHYSMSSFLQTLGWLGIVSSYYISTAFFLGPGEFAKEKKEELSEDMATYKV